MANLCTNIGVLISFASLVGIIYTLASKEWKRNSQVSSQPNAIGTNSYEGLWVRCFSPVSGTIQCDQYDDSILGLHGKKRFFVFVSNNYIFIINLFSLARRHLLELVLESSCHLPLICPPVPHNTAKKFHTVHILKQIVKQEICQ